MSKLRSFLRNFVGSFAASGFASMILYFGLRAAYQRSPFMLWCSGFCRIIPYWDKYPIPYLLMLGLAFGLSSAVRLSFGPQTGGFFAWLQIGAMPFIALLVASVLCGAVWAYHDMQTGFFPQPPQMIGYLGQILSLGILMGPLYAIGSFPLNILGYAAACGILAAFWHREAAKSQIS